MISYIKKEFLNNTEKLKEFLEIFGFANIKIYPNRLSFGRDIDSSSKSLVIKTINNNYLYITDYPKNLNMELFSYICKEKNIEFSYLISSAKYILGLSDGYYHVKKRAFGGFYSGIKNKNKINISKTYDVTILDKYKKNGNIKFLKDNISLYSQRFFGIGYDIESQSITIPIKNQIGEIIGVKERRNYESLEPDFQKYIYIIPCQASSTLYGYSDNYQYLVENTIFVFEAEKSVMQCFSYGIRNCVSLGSGSLSSIQAKMLIELNPKKIIFCLDEGFDLENTMKNINVLKAYSRFSEFEIGFWDWTKGNYKHKSSPSDMGKQVFENIIKNEIVFLNEVTDEI